MQFFCFFPPFSTFFFLHSPLFLRVPLYLVALYFCFSFQFNSCLSVALYPCFIYLRFTSVFSHFFLLFFSSPSLPYCHSVSAFAFLVHIFPSALFTSRFHSFIPTPLFQHPHLHPSLPSLPTTCTPPSPEQSLPGGHSGTAFVRAAVRGTLTRRQLRSAPPSAAAQRCSPPGSPPGAWSRCRPPRATNRRCRSRVGFSARRGRRESCCSVFLPTPFLLLLPAGGV